MSEVQPLRVDNPVASNVRAELARRGIKISHLERLVGQNTAYWGRRDRGGVPYDADDLISLATLLDLDPGTFFAGATKPPADRVDEGPAAVRRQGLEPRTRYIRASASQDGIARILHDERADEPHLGCEPIPPADVVLLPTWRNRPGVTRENATAVQ